MPKLSEAQRTKFYNEVVAATSTETSDILSSAVLDVGWDDLATKSELAELRGDFADLRGDFADLRGDFAELRGDVRTQIAELRVELHDSLRTQTIWMVSTMIAIAGVVVAAVHFA